MISFTETLQSLSFVMKFWGLTMKKSKSMLADKNWSKGLLDVWWLVVSQSEARFENSFWLIWIWHWIYYWNRPLVWTVISLDCQNEPTKYADIILNFSDYKCPDCTWTNSLEILQNTSDSSQYGRDIFINPAGRQYFGPEPTPPVPFSARLLRSPSLVAAGVLQPPGWDCVTV